MGISRLQRWGRMAKTEFQDRCLKLLDHLSGWALTWRKGHTHASFARAAASASGKPQNFNAVFTTGRSRRLAGRLSACILTNDG